jgi:hypothetical protein
LSPLDIESDWNIIRPIMKYIYILVSAAITFCLIYIVTSNRPDFIPHSVYEYKFYKMLKESKEHNKNFNLSELNSTEWDEVAFWAPYENICSLGIEGYKEGSRNCEFSEDDGECYLIFLKENRPVSRIRIARIEIDWAASALPKRISRRSAIFKISNGQWPKIEILD